MDRMTYILVCLLHDYVTFVLAFPFRINKMDDEKLKMLLLRARAVEESMNKNKSTVKYKKSGKDCQSGGKHPVSVSLDKLIT